jgi:cysteine-rich repeat protein
MYRASGGCLRQDEASLRSRGHRFLWGGGVLSADGDEIPDPFDNCPMVANILQEDADGDGIGDACEASRCGDGIVQVGESCDDGNAVRGDGCELDCRRNVCVSGTTIAKPLVRISKLGGPDG